MARVSMNLSVDPTLKAQAAALYAELGLDLSTAVTMFLRRSLVEQGIPFPVSRVPGAETQAALREAGDILSGRIPARRYPDVKSALDAALAEEDDDA